MNSLKDLKISVCLTTKEDEPVYMKKAVIKYHRFYLNFLDFITGKPYDINFE